jgi:hypothetical protein
MVRWLLSLLIAVFSVLFLAFIPVNADTTSVRNYDGIYNNLENPLWGSSNTLYSVEDGFTNANYTLLPNERHVSNILMAEKSYGKLPINFTLHERIYNLSPDPIRRNNLHVIMGQYITHDLTENNIVFNLQDFSKNFQITVLDVNDPLYEALPPAHLRNNTKIMSGYPRNKLITFDAQGVTINGTEYGLNLVTSFIDASTVYGSDRTASLALRSKVDGKLHMHIDRLPYFSSFAGSGLRSQCGMFGGLASGAGDFRADENPVLESLHTIWVREHNRKCEDLKNKHPDWDDENLYQEARKYVIALHQQVAVYEWLKILIGETVFDEIIGKYQGYNKNLDPSLSHSFVLSAIRVPHDQVNFPLILPINDKCDITPLPGVTPGYEWQERANCLREFTDMYSIDQFIKGAYLQFAQSFDGVITDNMRSIYSKADTPFANFDVEAGNIHRGRKNKVPTFYQLKKLHQNVDLYDTIGCIPGETDSLECFLGITKNITRAANLQNLYKRVNQIDSFVGFVVEDDKTETLISKTAAIIYAKEFKKIRDADRFWFENNMFTNKVLKEIKNTKFSDIIERNTNIMLKFDAFHVHKDALAKICPLL